MGCNCGGRKATLDSTASTVRTGFASVNVAGTYDLASAPGCTQPYTGIFERATVYVVGLGAVGEKIFVRGDVDAAKAYARETRLKLYHLPARALCHDTMLELLGA